MYIFNEYLNVINTCMTIVINKFNIYIYIYIYKLNKNLIIVNENYI